MLFVKQFNSKINKCRCVHRTSKSDILRCIICTFLRRLNVMYKESNRKDDGHIGLCDWSERVSFFLLLFCFKWTEIFVTSCLDCKTFFPSSIIYEKNRRRYKAVRKRPTIYIVNLIRVWCWILIHVLCESSTNLYYFIWFGCSRMTKDFGTPFKIQDYSIGREDDRPDKTNRIFM